MNHDKFRAYWESIGNPEIELFDGKAWGDINKDFTNFMSDFDYRIKGDVHHELRRKWIESDFTLPIEIYDVYGWFLIVEPNFYNDRQYREAKQQYKPSWDYYVSKTNITETLKERGNKYGTFDGNARITQSLKDCMSGKYQVTNWDVLSSDKKEALEMIAHKIGRILNGDPDYDDSWIDIAGYAQLVVNQLHDNA